MNNLDKKQKIITIVFSVILMIGICYYVYAKGNNNIEDLEIIEEENLNEIEDNKEKENNQNMQTIKVHISGAVNKEGIIELEENSRIADAIEKAGGIKENACMDEINLAYMLEDGMKIKIPTIEEVEEEKEKILQNNLQINEKTNIETEQKYITNGITQKSNTAKTNTQNSKININTASQTELETLPGIGASIALKIINYRKENGDFETIEEIKQVSGIGESKYSKIKELISVK